MAGFLLLLSPMGYAVLAVQYEMSQFMSSVEPAAFSGLHCV